MMGTMCHCCRPVLRNINWEWEAWHGAWCPRELPLVLCLSLSLAHREAQERAAAMAVGTWMAPPRSQPVHDRATSAFLSTVRTAEHVRDELLVLGSTGYRRLRHKIPSLGGLENPMSRPPSLLDSCVGTKKPPDEGSSYACTIPKATRM